MAPHKQVEDWKALVCGIAAILVALWLWYILVWNNPLEELTLIRGAKVTTGRLVDSFSTEAEGSGRVYFGERGVYAYRVPDGREFKTTTDAPVGQLAEQQEVEYLPENPVVSRIKGDGHQNMFEWSMRVVASVFLLALFVSPGVVLVRSAYTPFEDD